MVSKRLMDRELLFDACTKSFFQRGDHQVVVTKVVAKAVSPIPLDKNI